MSRQWLKIMSLILIRFNDLTVQSFFMRNFFLRISRINSTRIVVLLYTSWLHSLRARSTSSYHTIVHQSYNNRISLLRSLCCRALDDFVVAILDMIKNLFHLQQILVRSLNNVVYVLDHVFFRDWLVDLEVVILKHECSSISIVWNENIVEYMILSHMTIEKLILMIEQTIYGGNNVVVESLRWGLDEFLWMNDFLQLLHSQRLYEINKFREIWIVNAFNRSCSSLFFVCQICALLLLLVDAKSVISTFHEIELSHYCFSC